MRGYSQHVCSGKWPTLNWLKIRNMEFDSQYGQPRTVAVRLYFNIKLRLRISRQSEGSMLHLNSPCVVSLCVSNNTI